MAPQRNVHYSAIRLAQRALERAFGPGYWVRLQGPLRLLSTSEPEPDVAVVRGDVGDYPEVPTGALLVVEISDTSLAFDRREKADLYASAGIADYWVVNLVDRRVEVFRAPAPDAASRGGARYTHVTPHSAADRIAPLSAPDASICVADLLP